MPGTDLLYDVTGKSLKESLVLDALPGTASYTFLLECASPDRRPEQRSFGDAGRRGPGEAVLVIEAPLYVGRGGGRKLRYCGFAGRGAGRIPLHHHTRPGMAGGGGAALSVTVDPTMSAPNNWSTIKDTTGVYNSSMGTLNTTAEKKTIKVGNRQGSEVVGLVYQPMPSLLNDTSRIIEASLVLCQRADGSPTCSGRRPDQRPSHHR